MNASELYGEGYFLRGEGSNYINYSWLGEPTLKMASHLIKLLGIEFGETVCDIGCARGFLVRALRETGVYAYGFDIATWPIEHCDEKVKPWVSNKFPDEQYDYFIMKDVAEHLSVSELSITLSKLIGLVRKSILIISPLSSEAGGPFLRKEDSLDATHIIRWPLESWLDFIQSLVPADEFSVSGSWHYPGLKPSSNSPLKSCGFIHIKKIV